MSFGQGAALGVPAATAYRALVLRAHVKAGETVLVHGASGAVGIAAVQLARGLGLRVVRHGRQRRRRQRPRARPAPTQVFDHEPGRVRDRNRARPPAGAASTSILEMLANVNLDRDLTLLAPKGRVVVIGNRGRIEIDPRLTMGKETAILGTTLWSTTPEEYTQIHAGAGRGARIGRAAA